jgi:hypothetical protein
LRRGAFGRSGSGSRERLRPQVERLRIDHDLAATRREDPDERAHRRQVERAVRPPSTVKTSVSPTGRCP